MECPEGNRKSIQLSPAKLDRRNWNDREIALLSFCLQVDNYVIAPACCFTVMSPGASH